MNCRLHGRSTWVLLNLFVLSFCGFGALDSARSDDATASAPASNSPSVKKVTVTPSTDPFQPGNVGIELEVNSESLVLPPGPKTGEMLEAKAGRLKRVLKLEPAQLIEWQRKYVDAVNKTDSVLELNTPGPFRKVAKPAEMKKLAADTEKKMVPFELPEFKGLPPLSADEEQKIIRHCLMVTDLRVVEDPQRTRTNGVWTFGHAIRGLVNPTMTGINPSDFVKNWLRHWQVDQSINGNVVPNRKAGIEQLILNVWPRVAGTDDLDLDRAPFRLLAIASRLDLRSNLVLGAERIGGGGAGEARLVFCAVDQTGAPLAFTVIFEYDIKKHDYQAVREWALEWYSLKDKELGTVEYNSALERLTEQFVGAGTDAENPPNRSALGQLRTNEIALVADPRIRPTPRRSQQVWEIREFRIDINNSGQLRQVTTKQTPDLSFNDPFDFGNQAILTDFINSNETDILNKRHRTPLFFAPVAPEEGFLSGSAITPVNIFWNSPLIRSPEARHLFSLGTCSACHAAETFPKFPQMNPQFDDLTVADRIPPHFTHVRPRMSGQEAKLSPFLTGVDEHGMPYQLPDPSGEKRADNANVVRTRTFHDLSDRANDLRGIVDYGTYYEAFKAPSQRTH